MSSASGRSMERVTESGSKTASSRRPLALATVTEQAEAFAVQIRSGHHTFMSDEPVSSGGRDTRPSPTQLVLASLGSCTTITLRMYAARKEWAIGRIQVRVQLVEV